MTIATARLTDAMTRTKSVVSVGLEPAPAYLPAGFPSTIDGYEAFLNLIIDATKDIVPAYKFNLAFFEALGSSGMDLLHRVRMNIPEDVFVIADAKRGDIGSTAEHYARAMFDSLGADAVTLNPLMGLDSAMPFLVYENKLNYILCLTSNPGAREFLIPNDLYLRIAQAAATEWNIYGNTALVVGATNTGRIAKIREAAPRQQFLMPGIGAQGGDLRAAAQEAKITTTNTEGPGFLLHVTRGLLPNEQDAGDPFAAIRSKVEDFNARSREAINHADTA